ncbi:MAG: fluoride efflux transporter CrcB [Dysgonamonadaceae bacterium]|jgi:CrcB protein|nr:fluoride efflux transporter CrcB [Dysgonamonadaceae bacterium]
MKTILLIALGGALGSVLRYVAGECIHVRMRGVFPWATLSVNLLGCFLIGIAAGLIAKYGSLSGDFRLFFAVGFCGGFTTFSAFSREILQLLMQGHSFHAVLYVFTSIIVGVSLTFAGWFIISR